jgi:glutaredoxin 3
MYATTWCPYCARARALLAQKQVTFTEIDIDAAPEQKAVMIEKSGRRTVPQIFIGDRSIGGCDDLYALEQRGELDALLAGH